MVIKVYPIMSYTSDDLGRSTRKIALLVVDDDKDDFFVLRRKLQSVDISKYCITYVDSYDDALDALKSSRFDAVLMDYFIGNRAGTEVFGTYDNEPDVPIIILTGNGSAEIERDSLDAGAFDFMNKNDVTSDNLAWAIDTAAHGQASSAPSL